DGELLIFLPAAEHDFICSSPIGPVQHPSILWGFFTRAVSPEIKYLREAIGLALRSAAAAGERDETTVPAGLPANTDKALRQLPTFKERPKLVFQELRNRAVLRLVRCQKRLQLACHNLIEQ